MSDEIPKASFNDLANRVRQLETAAKPERESVMDRIEREREERRVRAETDRYDRGGESGSRPLNPRRSEAIQQRVSTLHPPATSGRRAHSPAPDARTPIVLHCWKEGKVGTITFLIGSDFEEDT